MNADDTIDIRFWTEIAPLESAQLHLRNINLESEKQIEEWFSELDEEEQSQLERIRRMVKESTGQSAERDLDQDLPQLDNIVSPITLAYVEQFRKQKDFAGQGWPSRPVDAFVWAIGEAPERSFTKIGGLPYRPAGLPWPLIAPSDGPYPVNTGAPMTFLGQLNFRGSLDLFQGDLPGEILLIFAEDETFSRPEALYFEWFRLGIPATDLIAASDLPAPGWTFVSCHGFRHRSIDYDRGLAESIQSHSPWDDAAILHATKIGGYEKLIHDDRIEHEAMRQSSNTHFLAQICSICPRSNEYYPWLNSYDLMDISAISRTHTLEMGDAGSLYLTLDNAGQVGWDFMCY